MGRYATHYLAENPWFLVGVFGAVGVGFLVALRVTQDGRYLTRAMIALGLAATVLIVETVWVTDNERIERVVHDLARAVARSDADGVIALLDQHVTFSLKSTVVGEEIDPTFIREVLDGATFDWVHVSRLETNAGEQTRRGSAAFRVGAAGSYQMTIGTHAFAGNTEWSLGFRKLPDGVWKINRIAAVSIPSYTVLPNLVRRRLFGTPIEAPRTRGRR